MYAPFKMTITLLHKHHLYTTPILPYTAHMAKWNIEEDRELAKRETVLEYLDRTDNVPWDKLPHESMKAYRAFCAYRDAGRKRSINYLRGQGLPVASVWVQEYKWTLRTRIFDEYTLANEQIEQHKLNREMKVKHAEQAAKALDGLMAPFIEFQRRSEQEPERLKEDMALMDGKKLLSTMQASARVLQPIMSAERLARDMPTEMVETHVQGQITVQDSPEALADVLGVLAETGVLASLVGAGPVIDVVDTSDEQMGEDDASPEASSLPVSASA